ncbi:hypothetical protein [Nostoc sp.]
MATINEYRRHIQNLLTEHAKLVWDDRLYIRIIRLIIFKLQSSDLK